MKIKLFFTFFSLLFFSLSSYSFAKENNPKKISLSDKKSSKSEVEAFDFQKLFSEAEAHYKSAKSWNKIKCYPKTGFICDKWDCNKRNIKTFLILDKKAEIMMRCEGDNCESFDAEFKQTGVFYNVQTRGPIGSVVRILGDSRYKEITTVGLDAYIANGECKVIIDEEEDD
jgi:hypothetical protein